MNKIEEYKKEKDGLEVIRDIPRYAENGWETITEADKERLRFFAIMARANCALKRGSHF